MPTIPTMSLKTAPIQFAEFKPVQYTPQIADSTLLAKSLSMQEARAEKARSALGSTDTLLNGIRNAINPEEYTWFENQANDIRKKIDDQIALGNTETAIKFAQEAGRDLARSVDMNNKVKANAIYQQELNKIKSGAYSELTKRRWEDTNTYYDNGTGNWKAENFIPVKDISVSDVWANAVAKTPTRSKSSGGNRSDTKEITVDNAGRPIKAFTKETVNGKSGTIINNNVLGVAKTITTSSNWSSGYNSKSKEDIMNIFNDLMSDPNIYAGVKQQYDNLVWLYDKSKSIIDNPNSTPEQIKQAKTDLDTAQASLEDKDGFLHKDDNYFKTWVQKQANRYAEHSKFYNTSSSKGSSYGEHYGDVFTSVNNNRAENYVTDLSPAADGTVPGPNRSVTAGIIFPSNQSSNQSNNSGGFNYNIVSIDANDYTSLYEENDNTNSN